MIRTESYANIPELTSLLESPHKILIAKAEEKAPDWKDFLYVQYHENDPAQVVILHEPALPNWMGSIHPNGSLYELPVDIVAAKQEHDLFRKELENHGVKVFSVQEILLMDSETNIVARVALEDFAFESITYKIASDTQSSDLTETDKFYLSDKYKRQCVDKMNNTQLVEVILTNPTITLKKADKDTELLAVDYAFHPLVNLVYCRDQQITTLRGIVMAAPSSPVRAPEVRVMKFCFQKLGLKIVGEIPSPGKLEGGDFYPAGKDLCLIGVGLRSNMFAVNYMLERDLFGSRRVAVVKDYFDQNQQRMHLDTVCNILNHRLILVLETIMGSNSPIRRLVDEYTKESDDGPYRLTAHDIEFSEYLKKEGFSIIPVTEEHQIAYGCNCLNLGNGNIISVDKATAKHLARNPLFNGRIINLDFRNMTNMYGSVHCCSQVVSRGIADTSKLMAKLWKAAVEGSVDQALSLLAKGVDINGANLDLKTALHFSVAAGNLEFIKFLIAEGADLNPKDRIGYTHKCRNHAEITQALRDAGAKTREELSENYNSLSLVNNKWSLLAFSLSVTEKQQSASVILMIAPTNFYENVVTESTNIWMKDSIKTASDLGIVGGRRVIRQMLLKEFSNFHMKLSNFGVETYLYTHESYEDAPEAVFCRDWFSTHSDIETGGDSVLVLYPIYATNRRNERRGELINYLKANYKKCLDLTSCEEGIIEHVQNYPEAIPYGIPKKHKMHDEGRYLEFSGLVLDRVNKVAYVSLSQRCHLEVAELWARVMRYELVTFRSYYGEGEDSPEVLHTNKVLQIGTGYAVFCSSAVRDEKDRSLIIKKLRSTGHDFVLELARDQMQHFSAQCHELRNKRGDLLLIMSSNAYNTLSYSQIKSLEKLNIKIVHSPLDTLEKIGGGSVSSIINDLF